MIFANAEYDTEESRLTIGIGRLTQEEATYLANEIRDLLIEKVKSIMEARGATNVECANLSSGGSSVH